MQTLLHTKMCWFTDDGRLEVYNHKLALKLNRIFRRYLNGDGGLYQFRFGDEAIFKVPPSQFMLILPLLNTVRNGSVDKGAASV